MTRPQNSEPRPSDPLADILRLTDVLDRENAALVAGDRETLRSLAEEKRLACSAFVGAEKAIREAAEADDLDNAAKRRLRDAAERLAQASAENRRRLAASLAAHKRLLEIIADAVRSHNSAAGNYARDGAPRRRNSAMPPPQAVSFDRAL